MKRYLPFIIAIAMLLSGCSDIELPSAEELIDNIIIETPQPEIIKDSDQTGSPIIIDYILTEQTFSAPDGSGFTIARYSCQLPHVFIEGWEYACDKINEYLLKLEENYYTGREGEVGIDQLYEMATDSYSNLFDTMTPFVLDRVVKVESQTDNYIAFLYTDTYTIETGKSYITEKRFIFDTQTGQLAESIDTFPQPASPATADSSIRILNQPESNMVVIDRVELSPNGQTVYLSVEGTARDVEISRAVNDNGTVYAGKSVWYCSRLSNCAVKVTADNYPETPMFFISCKSPTGETVTFPVS